jgi:probable rRNA maturation factor
VRPEPSSRREQGTKAQRHKGTQQERAQAGVASAPRGRRGRQTPCSPHEAPHRAGRPRVAIAWRLRSSWSALPLLRRAARYVAQAVGFRTGQLSVAVVGAATMANLHQRFAGKTGPTDVLTFDLGSCLATGHLDAEIVLCAAVARQRTSSRAGARAELALYLTHGLLHLAGYDDHTARAAARMHAHEDDLLQQLGLGVVYRSSSTAAAQEC